MAWDDQQPPWGKNKKPANPEDFIVALIDKIKKSFSGGGGHKDGGGSNGAGKSSGGSGINLSSIKKIIPIVVILAAVVFFQGAFFKIQTGSLGVVLRLGQFNRIAEPGLKFKIPLVDVVHKVDVQAIRKEEFGFRTRTAAQKSIYERRGFDMESLMLTGDKNVINVEWIVQYKVLDPVNLLFKVKEVEQAVRDVSEMTVRRIVGNHDFDFVLDNREVLGASMARELQATLDEYESGVKITTLQLQDVNPPDEVKPAFNEVNEADQDQKRLVNEAEEIYNRVVPKARGNAKRVLEEAHGYAVERVNLAKGETYRYLAVLKEYKEAKNVTRERMYLETMREVLPKVTEIYVIDKEQRSILPFLNLRDGKGKLLGGSKVEN